MRNIARLALVLGLGIQIGNGQASNLDCESPMRLIPEHATVYLEYERSVEKGQVYLVSLHNNARSAISVTTPCGECKHIPCHPESATPFQPLYRVNGITGRVLIPNNGGGCGLQPVYRTGRVRGIHGT